MQKTAQKRSLLNKLRESTNISGIATEKLFDPKFKDIMDRLRDQVDDPIRAIVMGETVGSFTPDNSGQSLKDLLKNAKDNLNAKEYLKCFAQLARFHSHVESIVNKLSSFKKHVGGVIGEVHDEFLFGGLDDDTHSTLSKVQQRYLQKRKNNSKAAAIYVTLHKNAGLIDLFLGRNKGLSTWEKLYPQQFKQLKDGLADTLRASFTLLSSLITKLKEMGSFRATRKVDKYIAAGNDIIKSFTNYDTVFDNFVDKNQPILNKLESRLPQQPSFTQESILEPVHTQPMLEQQVSNKTVPQSYIGSYKAPPIPDLDFDNTVDTTKKVPIKPEDKPPTTLLTSVKDLVKSESPKNEPEVKTPVKEVKTPVQSEPTVYEQIMQPGALQEQKVPSVEVTKSEIKEKFKPEIVQEVPQTKSEKSTTPLQSQDDFFAKKGPLKPPPRKVKAHQEFLNTLESLSNEHPSILANFIAKYAFEIQKSDPETALSLFKISKSIRG